MRDVDHPVAAEHPRPLGGHRAQVAVEGLGEPLVLRVVGPGDQRRVRDDPAVAVRPAALGEPRQRPVAGLAAGAARGPLDLVQRRRIGRGAAQPVEVDPLVGAFQQRLLGQVREVVAVGAHAAGHRVAALRLGRAVLPPGHPDARDQPAQVPLPRARVGLVEVVEVEDQVALGRGVEAEVAQVGVAADDGQDPGRGQPRRSPRP